MVGWPRQEQFTVCAMQMSRRSEIVICSYSKQVQLAGPVLEGQVVDNLNCSQNAGNQKRWMENSKFNTCSTKCGVVGLFRWRPCCKTLLKLSEVPREAVENLYFEIV